jgi:ribulose-5-phosphate 4-epimerase/fuculose-1-phosphate aldolase
MTESSLEEAGRAFISQSPPTFDNLNDHRRYLRERLAGACRVFGRAGFSEGLLGHMTVRDPEDHKTFWANPIGVSFNRMKASDVVLVNHAGELLEGNRPINPVGLRLHAAIHRARQDVMAVCHAHSTYASAWSAYAEPVEPITQDSCVFYDDQAIIQTEPRIAMSDEQADEFAAAFGGNKVGLQVGHGLFTTGATIDEAAWWFLGMDKACHIQLMTRAAGPVGLWSADQALGVRGALGTPGFGWLSYQTLWDEIVLSDPDLVD